MLVLGLDQIGYGAAVPEHVAAPVSAGLQTEDFLQDLQVVGNGEGVAQIFVAEEIIKGYQASPKMVADT